MQRLVLLLVAILLLSYANQIFRNTSFFAHFRSFRWDRISFGSGMSVCLLKGLFKGLEMLFEGVGLKIHDDVVPV